MMTPPTKPASLSTSKTPSNSSIEPMVKVPVPPMQQIIQKPAKKHKTIWKRIIEPPVKARKTVATTTETPTTSPKSKVPSTKAHETTAASVSPPAKSTPALFRAFRRKQKARKTVPEIVPPEKSLPSSFRALKEEQRARKTAAAAKALPSSFRAFRKAQQPLSKTDLRHVRPVATIQAKKRRNFVLDSFVQAAPIFCLLILFLLILFFAVGFGFLFVIPIDREDDNCTMVPLDDDTTTQVSVTKRKTTPSVIKKRTTTCECVTKPTTTLPVPVNKYTAHLFSTPAIQPSALFWDEIFQTLYFVDPTQSRLYWWRSKYGKKKCSYAEVHLMKDKNLKDPENTSKYKIMFAYPFKGSAKTFTIGLGPIIAVATVDTLLEEKEAKASYLAEICDKGQTITTAKPSPFGSLFIACRDDPIRDNSIAKIYKYHKKTKKLLVDHYRQLWAIFGTFTHRYITGIAFSSNGYVDPRTKWPRAFFVDSVNGILTEWGHNPKTDEIYTDAYTRFRTFKLPLFIPWDMCMDGNQYLWATMVNENKVSKFHTRRKHEWDEYWYNIPGVHTYGIVQGLRKQKTFIVSAEANDELKRLTNKNVSGIFYALNGHYRHRYTTGSIYYIEFQGILNRSESELQF